MARKKQQRPSSDELEAMGDALLKQADHDLLVALAENVEALREGFEQLKLPSNDPEYLKKLQATDAARNAIANRLTQIDIVPDGNKSYLGVGGFKHHEAKEIALMLADHFEMKIRQHD